MSASLPGIPGADAASGGIAQPRIVLHLAPTPNIAALRGALRGVRGAWRVVLVAGFLLYGSVSDIFSGRIGWPLAIVAVVVGTAAVLAIARRTTRIEWDGKRVVLRDPISRQVIGLAGTGQIVRADLRLSDGNVLAMQYWVDARGKVRGRLLERVWDPAALSRIAHEADIPFTNEGTITEGALAERHPDIELVPKVLGLALTLPVGRGR